MSDAPPVDRFARRQPWKHRGLDPTGRKLCFCGCGQPVGPRRSSSAGPECVKRWKDHSDTNHIRWVVERRDKGVCAICGADTAKLREDYRSALVDFGEQDRKGYGAEYLKTYPLEAEQVRSLNFDHPRRPMPPPGFPESFRRWWEADHIVPVIEGGGGCGPDGYRTLCLPCHKRETAKLAARRAAARRPVPQPEFQL